MNSTKENLLDSIMYELAGENEITINNTLGFVLNEKKSVRLKDLSQI